MKLEFTVPVRATASLNARMHWRARAREVKRERQWTAIMFSRAEGSRDRFAGYPFGPFAITLTRIGPRKLDSDNVQGALKAIRDEVANQLGIDDGDERLTWNYAQEKGEYAVRVVIETAEERAA